MLPISALPDGSHIKPAAQTDEAHGKAESPHGSWRCSACTMANNEEYVNCTTCMTQRPGKNINLKEEQKKMKQVAIVNPSFSVRFKALFSKPPPQWQCPTCTFVNRGIYNQCQSCWYHRTQEEGHSHHEVASRVTKIEEKDKVVRSEDISPSTNSTSVFGSIRAFFQRSSSTAGSKGAVAGELVKEVKEEGESIEERDGEEETTRRKWKCQQCTLLNPESHEKCSVCELPKNFEMPTALAGGQTSMAHSPTHNGQFDEENDGGTVQLDPEIGMDDVPTPLPVISAQSPQDQRQVALLSSQGAPTWRCKVCGAFNVINSGLRQCFICGIGVIPECYLPLAPPVREGYRPYSSPHPRLRHNHISPHPFPQPQAGQQHVHDVGQPQFQDSVDQDYVNLPQIALRTQGAPHNQRQPNPSRNGSSPSHPLTRVNHLHASSSLSPLHITSSNGGVSPKSEPSYVNCRSVYPSRSLRHSKDANYRDILLCESGDNLSHIQLQYSPLGLGDFSHDMEESCIDPYVRPRTPVDYLKLPSPQSEHQPAKWQRVSEPTHQQRQKEEGEEEETQRLVEANCHYNRTKCVDKRREEDVLRANIIYQEIVRYSKTNGELFTDPDFPPADKSLYTDPSQPVVKWQVGKWERPSETRDDFASQGIQWTVLREEARPEDIAQGVLGNCWVLSALGVIAEQPQLIEDILITKQYCPEVGAYQVRLCRDGRWEVVVVDDCFPCLNTGELVFSKAHRKQLWVPLIEKALAKLYGSYQALNAGRVLLGLSVLTGLPCEKIHLKRPSVKGEEIDTDLVWARLLSFRERGFPMSAACGGDGGEEEERVYALLGLESNHAYSILDVRQIGSDQLIRLRNPWGKYSWKGSWSDSDPRWDSQPWMRDELRAVGGDAGVFWMGVYEFFQYFCEVDVCKYRPHWHSLRSEGKLLPFAAPQVQTLAFQVHTTTEVDISIYQPSSRGRGRGHNLVDMSLLVLCYSHTAGPASPSSLHPISCSLESGSHIQSIVTISGFLGPGHYLILPLAFNHYRHTTVKLKGSSSSEGEREEEEGERRREEGAIPYVLAVFSARELVYENVSTSPGFLPESLMLLAEKTGRVTESFPNMLLYEVYMKHSCRYMVAVNLDPQLHFTVSCDGRDSRNVTCSRGELYTEDCIPPRHRQILWVLTQLEGTARYSVLMKISSTCSQYNPSHQWGAQHYPPLTPTTAELHTPRFITD